MSAKRKTRNRRGPGRVREKTPQGHEIWGEDKLGRYLGLSPQSIRQARPETGNVPVEEGEPNEGVGWPADLVEKVFGVYPISGGEKPEQRPYVPGDTFDGVYLRGLRNPLMGLVKDKRGIVHIIRLISPQEFLTPGSLIPVVRTSDAAWKESGRKLRWRGDRKV